MVGVVPIHNNYRLSKRGLLKWAGTAGAVFGAGCLGNTLAQQNGSGSTGGQNTLSRVTVALADDPTRETWALYGGVTPYWTNILEPLVYVGDNMELKPWLATDWEATGEDTWEFSLREGVQFHNGVEMTAEDVVWSFEEILEFFAWAPGWLQLESGNIEAVDPYTVEFTTVKPYPPFPGTIAHNMVAIQHSDRDAKANRVIGTGPFQVEEIQPGQEVRTTAFDDYWRGDPTIEELVFRAISDPNTRALSLKNGDVDIALDPPRSQVPSLEDTEDINIYRQERPAAGYASLNVYKSPTDDRLFRRALNHAVSSALIVETVLEGVAEPAKGPISPIIYWSAHDELDAYEQNISKATALVDQSSYNGAPIKILVPNDLTDGRTIAAVLQGAFGDIGVDAEVTELERAAYSEAERNGEAHVIIQESSSNSGDADYLLYEGFHSDGDVNQRLNREEGTGLTNLGGEVDALIETGQQSSDPDEKEAVYVEVQKRIMDAAVVLPLYYSVFVVGSVDCLRGLHLSAIPQFTRWTALNAAEDAADGTLSCGNS